MSEKARTALINVGTNRQGATPPPTTDAATLHELATLKLIGRGNGLTRRGTIKRQLLVEDLMEGMFA